jgi:hypothetical protein
MGGFITPILVSKSDWKPCIYAVKELRMGRFSGCVGFPKPVSIGI